ncbi:MAG: glycohydrolase toxin TNT-related protein, partial [Clostridiales bacterium]|nr:glycohydrolase toxin TNT-related protein [Clostridiales bacterium]
SFDTVKRSREWADTLRQSAVDTVAQTNPFINGIKQAAEFAVNTAERFKARYDNNCTLGDTQLKAAAAAVNLTLGDFVGYTTFLEGVLGVDSTTGELLGAGDRWLLGTVGAVQMLGSAVGGAQLIHAGRVALAGGAGIKAGSSVYPPNRGFLGFSTRTTLKSGTIIDRYGSTLGRFAAPQGTPASARSLPPGVEFKPLHRYEVVKPFDVDAGTAAPFYGQPGKGIQYDLGRSVQDLLDEGYLRVVK